MERMKLLILSGLFSALIFVGGNIYADNYPSFETLAATSITSNSAYLHGDFYSESNEIFPLVWFQYGTDVNSLNKKTEDFVETGKDYINTKLISGLLPETKYYFRTMMEINSSVYYGDILSFVTLPQENNRVIDEVNYSEGDPNYALDKMIHAYDASLSQGYTNKDVQDDNVSNYVDDGTYSFFDFLKWFKRKDNDSSTQSNLVHSEEEIKKIEEERKERLDKMSEQERYNNSAYEDDEFGEVVKYNTNYRKKNIKKNSSVTITVFTILFITAIIMLLRVFILKRNRFYNYKNNLLEMKIDSDITHRKYNIPIKRDLHDPIQNPNPEANVNNNRFLKDNHGK